MRAASDRRSALDVDLHHLRPARLHPGCEVDEDYGGANFIFKGYFSTMGMSILWPIRAPARRSNPAQARAARARARWLTRSCSLAHLGAGVLQQKSTGRWYENLVTPKPTAVSDAELALSLLPVGFVLLWPWLRLLAGEINVVEAFFDWYYPWAVTGAIWTVMTQVSHVQEDCQRPPSGDDEDDYFRWQARPRLQP